MVKWGMIRIAVCDDEAGIAAELERDLHDILDGMGVGRRIAVFHSAEDLRGAMDGGARFDLIFLDINFAESEQSGVDAALAIRGSGDDRASIVYVSWENRLAADLSGTRHMDFLLKPLDRGKIEEAVKTHIRIAGPDPDALFLYRKKRVPFSAPIRDIVYFESRGRKIAMRLRGGGGDEFYGTIKEILEGQLKGRDFLFAHASYLVNFDYVRGISYRGLRVEGREAPLPISHEKRLETRERYLEITDRRMGGRG